MAMRRFTRATVEIMTHVARRATDTADWAVVTRLSAVSVAFLLM